MAFKIDFVPWNTPLEKRLETLAASVWFHIMSIGELLFWVLTLFLIFCTKFWWFTLIYLVWMYVDRDTPETEGKRIECIRNSRFWDYMRNYFPIKIHRLPGTHFDSKQNYLFCYFPHGMLPVGAIATFCTNGQFDVLFPNLRPHLCSLGQNFYVPFLREGLIAVGVRAPSAKSINYLLSDPKGGHAVGLTVGGAAEAYYAKPRTYKLVLKNRKGFIKLALKNGSSLVPIISFGENDVLYQVDKGDGSWLKKCQEAVRRIIGIPPLLVWGRGFFQYTFGFIPHGRPLNIIVGAPIPVEKNENPTESEIDDLHQKFINELTNLFESQKQTYVENSDDIHLELA